MSGEFAEFGGVNPDLDPELAMALKVSAEEEQERRERQKQRQLVAGERGGIVVEDDSRDHRRTCSACPPSATRVNGAPPVFCASKVTGSAEVSVPADSGDQAVREALAAKLGVEGWQISLPSQQTRRAASNSGFSGHMSMRNVQGGHGDSGTAPGLADCFCASLSRLDGVAVSVGCGISKHGVREKAIF